MYVAVWQVYSLFMFLQQPFNSNSDQGKQSNGSSSSNSKDSKASDESTSGGGSGASGKAKSSSSSSSKSAKNSRKRSRSQSKSPSRSKSPVLAAAKPGRANKRRKSSEESGSHTPSNLAKGESRNKDLSTGGGGGTSGGSGSAAQPASLPIPRAPSIFTFEQPHQQQQQQKKPAPQAAPKSSSTTPSSSSEGQDNGTSTLTHSGSTLDDLCRAAAELERMDTTAVGTGGGASTENKQGGGVAGVNQNNMDDDMGKKRPGNISIPTTQTPSPAIERERHRLGATPPYTPPPILSPSRSLIHLAPGVGGQANTSTPCTPNRILPWNNYPRKVSETDEATGFSEPRINIGEEFQAVLPECDGKNYRVTYLRYG